MPRGSSSLESLRGVVGCLAGRRSQSPEEGSQASGGPGQHARRPAKVAGRGATVRKRDTGQEKTAGAAPTGKRIQPVGIFVPSSDGRTDHRQLDVRVEGSALQKSTRVAHAQGGPTELDPPPPATVADPGRQQAHRTCGSSFFPPLSFLVSLDLSFFNSLGFFIFIVSGLRAGSALAAARFPVERSVRRPRAVRAWNRRCAFFDGSQSGGVQPVIAFPARFTGRGGVCTAA